MLIEIHFGPFVTPQVVDQQSHQNHIGRLDELLNQVATLLAKYGNAIIITRLKSCLKHLSRAGTHLIIAVLRSLKTIPPPGGRLNPKSSAKMLSLDYLSSLY